MGEIDSITLIAIVNDLASCIPDAKWQRKVFADCGHGVYQDDPRAFEVRGNFINGN